MWFFFFFKQKTAYEIYQCDWSSDVCSSDLDPPFFRFTGPVPLCGYSCFALKLIPLCRPGAIPVQAAPPVSLFFPAIRAITAAASMVATPRTIRSCSAPLLQAICGFSHTGSR